MAFPTTPVLDDINRADADPISGNWVITAWPGRGIQIVSNQIKQSVFQGLAVWDDLFDADQEVYYTLPAISVTSTTFLYARTNDFSVGAGDAYCYLVNNGSSLNRIDNGVFTQLGSTMTITIVIGDKFGLSVIGTTLTAYRKPSAGSWGPIDTRTDSTYSAAGYISCSSNTSADRMDDFGGGTYVDPDKGPGTRGMF